MPRSHDKECFYKYMTAEVAQKVLVNGTLQLSAPSRFNDPFDHHVKFRPKFTEREAIKALSSALEQLALGGDVPNFERITSLSKGALNLRSLPGMSDTKKIYRKGCH